MKATIFNIGWVNLWLLVAVGDVEFDQNVGTYFQLVGQQKKAVGGGGL